MLFGRKSLSRKGIDISAGGKRGGGAVGNGSGYLPYGFCAAVARYKNRLVPCRTAFVCLNVPFLAELHVVFKGLIFRHLSNCDKNSVNLNFFFFAAP